MNNKEYKGLIFDLDGTLVDTVYDLCDSINILLLQNGFPEVTIAETTRNIGNGMFKLVQRSVPTEFKEDHELISKLTNDLINIYHSRVVKKSKPYPGIKELLSYCNKNNIPIGVASNKSNNESNLILETLFPEIKFTKILGHVEGTPHKPDPEVIKTILNDMNCNSEEVLYIGDSYTDYLTAKNSNLDSVLVTYGYEDPYKLLNLKDSKILDSSEELKKYLINLLKK